MLAESSPRRTVLPRRIGSRFWRDATGFCSIWTIHLGRRYGLFQELQQATLPLDPKALARRLHLHNRAVGQWCEAAHTLRLIRREPDGRYASQNTVEGILLDKGSAVHFGGIFSYLALRSLLFDRLDQYFRTGLIPASSGALNATEEATQWDHTAFLVRVLPAKKHVLSLLGEGAKVLEIGCGTGRWLIEMARAFPRSHFMGVDLDLHAVSKAKENCRRDELGGRVRVQRMDAEKLDFYDEFDLVYMGESLCAIRRHKLVLRNCLRALKPRGYLAVLDAFLDPGNSKPEPPQQLASFLQLDYALQGARFIGSSELRKMLKAAGFVAINPIRLGGVMWVFFARKPSQ